MIIQPLVSICIPTFNGKEFIREAILSALNQTYKDIEIIISDNYSKDETVEIAESLQKQSNIPFYIKKHKPFGIGDNWNNCVKLARGQYIKFLFQDDLLEPDCIEKMINNVQVNRNIGLVFCRRKIIFDNTNPEHLDWVKKFKELHTAWESLQYIQEGKKLLKDESLLITPRNKVGEPTAVLINKIVFDKIGYFNTSLKQALDYEFWYRVFTKFSVVFIDQELVSFRLHNNQTTSINSSIEINDYDEYPRLMYENCFFYLNFKVQRYLFFEFSFLGKLFRKFKHICIK